MFEFLWDDWTPAECVFNQLFTGLLSLQSGSSTQRRSVSGLILFGLFENESNFINQIDCNVFKYVNLTNKVH